MADLFPPRREPLVPPARLAYTQELLAFQAARTTDAIYLLMLAPFGGWPESAVPKEARVGVTSAVVALKEAAGQLCRALEAVNNITSGEE